MGCTPQLRHSYRRDRISAISGISVSPRRQRLGLYVQLHRHNITGTEVVGFLRHLLRHLRGPVVLLWDGHKIHRRRDVTAFIRQHPRLRAYPFPGYAPELNPDEFVWTKTKKALANGTPRDVTQLHAPLRRSLRRLQRSQRLLWSCIHGSELPWR